MARGSPNPRCGKPGLPGLTGRRRSRVRLRPVRQHSNDLSAFLSPFKFTIGRLGFEPDKTLFSGLSLIRDASRQTRLTNTYYSLRKSGVNVAINSSGDAPLWIKAAPASLAAAASLASTLSRTIFKHG